MSQTKSIGVGLVSTAGALNKLIRYVGALSFAYLSVCSAYGAPVVDALPQGGVVAQGGASIHSSANVMNIIQSSDKAVVNWQSFDIGSAASVNVLQPSATSVLLNRVVGDNPSQIFGTLNANGQVVLVNPKGIVFGSDGSVNAAAFTASTLGISDADFMAGNYRFIGGNGAGAIVNQGTISTRGYVALLGASVTNDGKIISNQGDVFLGAAQAISVPVSNSGRIKMELDPASVNIAINNTANGVIVTSGGQVFIQAAAINDALVTANITQSGLIDTSAAQAGSVQLLADSGNIKVSGLIEANSSAADTSGGRIIIGRDEETGVLAKSTNVNGAKLAAAMGFVETSGDRLQFVNTNVKAKDWLLDPFDITIDATNAGSINTSLNNGTSVTVTTATQFNGTGTSGNGDITVSSAITRTNNNSASLTLTADNNIIVNAGISSTSGAMAVNLNAAGTGGISGSSTGTISTNGGALTLNASNAAATGTLAGIISGTGSLTKTGSGTQVLTGANTYSGGTTISAGTLQVEGNGGLGSGAISNSANLVFNNITGSSSTKDVYGNNALKLTQTITSANGATVKKTGSGSVILVGNQNASGADYYVNGGTLSSSPSSTVAINFTANSLTIDNNGATSNKATFVVDADAGANKSVILNIPTLNLINGATFDVRNSNAIFQNNLAINATGANNLMTAVSYGGINTNGQGPVFTFNTTNATDTLNLGLSIRNGLGSVVKNGAGTLIVTSENATGNGYQGTTTINGGLLQVGNGGTTGTLGTGAIIDNANLTFNRSNAMTVANAISGVGTVNQVGTGTTTLKADNSYSGATTVSGGTLQIGSNTSTGSLGNTSGVTLSNNANLSFYKSANTTIDKSISGTGNVTANITGNLALTSTINLTSSNTINLTSSGAITETAGSLGAGNVYITAVGGAIGTSSNRIQTNATSLYASSGGNQYITDTNAGTVSIAAKTTASNGNIDILATAGALSVGSVNGFSGISTHGSGTISLTTNDGNINIGANLSTASTSDSAIVLNAGAAAVAGTAAGGDITVSGLSTISVGTGGRATLYTGSVSGSTGLTNLVVSGSGHFRYNSDETTSNFTAALGSGTYAIYREAPSITLQGNLIKTYDGQYVTSNSLLSEVGSVTATGGTTLLNGDTGNAAAANATFSFAGAAQQKDYQSGGYVISASQASSALGYNVTYSNGNLTINKANLTKVTASKTYDGLSTVTAAQMGDILGVNGESFTASGGTASIRDKDVAAANNTLINLSGLTLTGANNGLTDNYNFNSGLPAAGATTNSVTINKADLVLSGTRVYDAGTSYAGAYLTATGVNGETFAVTGVGDASNLSSKNVQTAQALNSVTGLSLGTSSNGGLSNNYNALSTTGSSVSVTAKTASYTATATNLTYNGSVQNQLASTTSGFISTDALIFTGEASGKNAGTYGSNLSVSGADATNYSIILTNANLVIGKANATVTANGGVVTYNGQAQSVTGFTATGLVNGEQASVLTSVTAGGSGTNAGTYTATAVGSDNNYNLTFVEGAFVIAKANATVTANSGNTTYNGQIQSVSGFTVTGLVNGEQASVLSGVGAGGSGTNAGSYATTATGVDGNYNLSFVDGTLTINKATLTASLVGTVTKEYDGTFAANNLTNSNFSVTGWATGESATVNQTLATYSSKNVDSNTSSNKGVVTANLSSANFTPNSITDLNNYNLPTTAAGNVGVITPASLTIKVNDTGMFVTQDPNQAASNGLSYTGFKNADGVSDLANIGVRTYLGVNNPSAGSYTNVYGLTTTPAANNGNYTITVVNGNLTVTPAAKLQITIGNENVGYGTLTALNAPASATNVTAVYCLNGSISCGGSNIVNLTMTNLGSGQWKATDTTNTSVTFSMLLDTAGHISTGGYLNVGNYSYDASQTTPPSTQNFGGRDVVRGVLTVTPQTLTLNASNVTKVYDGTNAVAGMALTPTGVMGGDAISVSSAGGTFGGVNAGSQSFSLTGLSLQGNDRANYSFASNSLSGIGMITQKVLTVVGGSAEDKLFDGNASVRFAPGQLNGLVTGETLSLTSSAVFSDANIGSNKDVLVTYNISNGSGLASNYKFANGNPSTQLNAVLHATIRENKPFVNPNNNTKPAQPTDAGSQTHVTSSGSDIVTVKAEPARPQNEVVASSLCVPTLLTGVDLCFLPYE